MQPDWVMRLVGSVLFVSFALSMFVASVLRGRLGVVILVFWLAIALYYVIGWWYNWIRNG